MNHYDADGIAGLLFFLFWIALFVLFGLDAAGVDVRAFETAFAMVLVPGAVTFMVCAALLIIAAVVPVVPKWGLVAASAATAAVLLSI